MDYKIELWLWLAASFLLYGLSAQLAWRYRQAGLGRISPWVARVSKSRFTPQLWGLLRFLYYVGIPYGALIRGVALPRLMGFTGFNWFQSLGLGAAIGVGAFLLILLGWWFYIRSLTASPLRLPSPPPSPSPWTMAWDALCLQTHWAFYRSAPMLLDEYWGIFLGFLLVSLEWWMNPAIRRGLARAEEAEPILRRWAIGIATTVVFYYTRNTWLLFPLHWMTELGLLKLREAIEKGLPAATLHNSSPPSPGPCKEKGPEEGKATSLPRQGPGTR